MGHGTLSIIVFYRLLRQIAQDSPLVGGGVAWEQAAVRDSFPEPYSTEFVYNEMYHA